MYVHVHVCIGTYTVVDSDFLLFSGTGKGSSGEDNSSGAEGRGRGGAEEGKEEE